MSLLLISAFKIYERHVNKLRRNQDEAAFLIVFFFVVRFSFGNESVIILSFLKFRIKMNQNKRNYCISLGCANANMCTMIKYYLHICYLVLYDYHHAILTLNVQKPKQGLRYIRSFSQDMFLFFSSSRQHNFYSQRMTIYRRKVIYVITIS